MHTAIEDRSLRLATTLAARLCHDMAGLLGTLGAVVDLTAEDPEAHDLAVETVATLSARVRLLRTAWAGAGGPLDAADIAALAQGLPGIERLRLDFSALDGPLAETPARLVLCLLLAALPGLPRGGALSLATAPRGAVRITLSGPGAAWPALLADCAASDAACWRATDAARTLAAPLACLLAGSAGWRVAVDGAGVLLSPKPGNRP
jgi:histidine phosphotransferase ChpT